MTTKEWLSRAVLIEEEIQSLKSEMDSLILPSGGSGERVQSSGKNSTENRFVSYAEYSRELKKQIDKLYEIKREIMEVISKVKDNTSRVLLIKRYINGQTWEDIADEMYYSDKWVRTKLHSKALAEAGGIIAEFLEVPAKMW